MANKVRKCSVCGKVIPPYQYDTIRNLSISSELSSLSRYCKRMDFHTVCTECVSALKELDNHLQYDYRFRMNLLVQERLRKY
jgi:hypothetical protein